MPRVGLLALALLPASLTAQASGLPSLMTPVRGSALYELAMLVAFPQGATWASGLTLGVVWRQ